ncbi:MAG: type II secretion system F family protein, partial [Planctomycetes bacterium]|nr:type II secretion system F family protein [Planctomycetota bacterium]
MRSEYRELLIQLRFLIRSGVPIREALSSLARRRRVSRLAGPLLEELERGESLGDAMAAHPR